MNVYRFVSATILLCIFGNLIGVEWSEPELIASTASVPFLAIGNDGICWCEAWPWMYSYRSETSGWQLEIELGVGYWGRPCFDKGDTLWLLDDDNYNFITCSRCYWNGWSGIDTVPGYPSCNDFAVITADSGGGVWVGWSTDWFGYFVGAYNRYKDGIWDEPKPINDTKEPVDHNIVDMTTDVYGRVWIAWVNYYVTEQGESLYLESTYYDGGGWSEEMLISNVEGHFPLLSLWALDLAPDRNGGIWALWDVECPACQDSFFVFASYWNGEKWSEPDTVAAAGRFIRGYAPYGRVAVDAYGNTWAVWRQALVEPYDKYCDIYYSVNSGSGWSKPAPVNEHPAYDDVPDLAVDGAGRVWCVWSSNRQGQDEYDYSVWASYATGVGVKEPVTPVTHRQASALSVDRSIGQSFTFRISSLIVGGEIALYDACGRAVRRFQIAEDRTISWDGSDERGNLLPEGVYFFILTGNRFKPWVGRLLLLR